MGETDQKLVMDVVAWLLNVSTSVFIVFVNKLLMSSTGYNFGFATTLCAFHFLACSVSIGIFQMLGKTKKVTIPFGDTVIFAIAANVSIASLNLSLLVNSVGFYQIAKLLIIPFVGLVEFFWLKKHFTSSQIMAMAVVISGVAIVSVTDVAATMLGVVIAALSVVSSGMQQILCGYYQRKHSVSSHQLLSNTAPVQGWSLLFIGPFVDLAVVHSWILDYEFNVPALACLGLSCGIAVLVNISQFMCLGRFKALSFQVLGHAKTVLVLLGGWLFLGDVVTMKQFCGICLAVAGMVAYGIASARDQPKPKPQLPKTRDGEINYSRKENGEV